MNAKASAGQDTTATGRVCDYCGRPLPASSRSTRRFCSSVHRQRAWDRDNRPPEDAPTSAAVRRHWHFRTFEGSPISRLVGSVAAGDWTGPGGCPPECRGLDPEPRYPSGPDVASAAMVGPGDIRKPDPPAVSRRRAPARAAAMP